MPLFIDFPKTAIESINPVIAGWVAGASNELPLRVSVDGRPVPYFYADRPDVRAAFPQLAYSSGIGAAIDILDIEKPDIDISVEFGNERILRHVEITAAAHRARRRECELRDAARSWCLRHFLCPQCKNPETTAKADAAKILCGGCGAIYPQLAGIPDFLPRNMRFALYPDPVTTSANPYDPAALALIEKTVAAGGMVLDCGAGFRPERRSNVINLEITAYRSTDVLAVGEALPFKDASFDTVISLAVLEHVRDPFACAREIIRVTRPGGTIMCSVPLLQPEHHFPGHFFNMTQSGVMNLFGDGTELLSAEVPLHGHPIFAVHWLLRDYLAGLPEPVRSRFATLTVGEIVASPPAHQLPSDYATELSLETWRTIACLNTLTFRRRPLAPEQAKPSSRCNEGKTQSAG